MKVKYLLHALKSPQADVAMDISEDFIQKTVAQLRKEFTRIPICAVAGDCTQNILLPPEVKRMKGKRVVFFQDLL